MRNEVSIGQEGVLKAKTGALRDCRMVNNAFRHPGERERIEASQFKEFIMTRNCVSFITN